MEAILVVIGIVYLLCPIIALLIALGARRQAIDLEHAVRQLRAELAARGGADLAVQPDARPREATQPIQAQAIAPAAEPEPEPEIEAPRVPDVASEAPVSLAPAAPGLVEIWAGRAKDWLFGGNLVAKVGLLILFIGVSFLLKYAAARVTVPIELRLAGIALADIALLIWGWRIRVSRPTIGLPVQGAALAILMMVTFGAFKLYHLLPAGFAFALLFALTLFTCLLAVLQDALWLAVFGIAGGFAVPILTSTGQGSHIALFSYYALLNAGVLGIALKRSWRVLNLIGFVFTFLIGTAWGVLQYKPEHYLSAQLFLILFFAFYVGIAIVYALREAPRLRHYVDGTLVFGTPLAAFGLQYGLVRHMQFGLALSALALGLFYMVLAAALWRRRGSSLRLLLESFFALAIVFGTLAIPFALDGRWTSAAWALEGAGIVWIGLRQRQTLAWMFGLLVQAGAWISFLLTIGGLDPVGAMQSNLWLGFLLLAATAFLMATNFRSNAADQSYAFGPIATAFLALAAVWFVAGAWTEIWLRTHGATRANLLVVSALLAALMLGFVAKRMQWQVARYFALAVQALAGGALLVLAALRLNWPFQPAPANLFDGPFLGALLIGSGAAFSAWVFQRQAQSEGDQRLLNLSRGLLAWTGFWWFCLILHLLTGWAATQYRIFAGRAASSDFDLWVSAYLIGLALSGPVFAYLAGRLRWPALRWLAAPNWLALGLASVVLVGALYLDESLPNADTWVSYLALWLSGEWLMRHWRNAGWPMREPVLKLLHGVRTVGPWLMIWPVGRHWIAAWLYGGTQAEQQMLSDAGWFTSGSWARYLPAWAMMAVIAWLMQRARVDGWPTPPIARWYRARLIPFACAWAIALVAIWNLTQNGSMAPLPYLPLLNPLDLSSGFALLLAVAAYRLARSDFAPDAEPGAWRARLPLAAGAAAYAWFNLMLLRSAAHFLDIRYQFEALFESQFVQAMLSLVWSATALLLMRRAVKHSARQQWMIGAALLAVVVVKLFLVDLSNVGGAARIISFVGVGLLMLAIGYLAPYPAQTDGNQTRT